jgi:hypothetical protein
MYYPKSQIKTNLYTNGEEYVVKSTQKPYLGWYYEVSNGKKFIGKSPSTGRDFEIVPQSPVNGDESTPSIPKNNDGILIKTLMNQTDYLDDPYYNNYLSTIYPKNKEFKKRYIPTPYISSPTESERQIGEYRRYFAKKGNELLYIEISKDNYTKFTNQDPNVAFDLYEVIDFPFSLTNTGTNINLAAIIERRDKWYGFSDFIGGLN